MTCKVCEENLLEYLYGELDEAGRVEMEKHLAGSPACREVLEGFRAVRARASEQDQEEPPPGFAARILAHAEEHHERKRRRAWTWMLRPVLATAAVAVVAAIVYRHGSQVQRPTEAVRDRIEREVREETGPPALLALRRAAPEEPATVPEAVEPLREETPGARRPEPRAAVPRKEVDPRAAGKSSAPAAEPVTVGASPPPARHDETAALRPEEPSAVLAPADRDQPVAALDEARLTPGRTRKTLAARAAGSRAPEEAEERMAERDAGPPAPLSETLDRARELAGAGRCPEAVALLEPLASRHPGEKAVGAAWLESARCFLAGGDLERAGKAALEARAFPDCARDAEAMLVDLGLLPDQP